jgi:hypothetical protein
MVEKRDSLKKEWEIERGDDDDERDELLREMSSYAKGKIQRLTDYMKLNKVK